MQAIIFIGIQATGKSSFYKQYFFNTHIRISLDLLNTRNKQNRFLQTCFNTHSKFVIDNTNPSIEDRKKFIELAKANKYEIVGYYFESKIEEALSRNEQRTGKENIPEVGIKACYKRLTLPQYSEGFDKLFYISIKNNQFVIQNWKNEI